MSNRLRSEILEEQEQEEKKLLVEENPIHRNPENFVSLLLSKGIVSTDKVTQALPFVSFVAFLGMIYIGNRHLAEDTLRNIDKISKEVKELSWDYKTNEADLAYKSTLSEVAHQVDTLGIAEPVEPPQKLVDTEGGVAQ